MTLPHEERDSLDFARDFLRKITNDKRVPMELRKQACSRLRHFPGEHRVNEIYRVLAERAPTFEEQQ